MASVTRAAVLRPIYRLWDEGTLVGSSDAQFLERFVARRDEAAFEALIARHGRAVLAVCRDVLRDPHDAEDASPGHVRDPVPKSWITMDKRFTRGLAAPRCSSSRSRGEPADARRRAVEKTCRK